MNIATREDGVTVITISDTNALTLGSYAERLKKGEVAREDGYIRRTTEEHGLLVIQIEDDDTHYASRGGAQAAGPAKDILDWPTAAGVRDAVKAEQAEVEPHHMGD